MKVLVPVDEEGTALDGFGKKQQLGQGLIATVLIRGLYDESEDENGSKGGTVGHGRMYVLADLINDQG